MAEIADRPEDSIDYVTPEVRELRQIAALPRALFGSTRKMREGRETWLPRARTGAGSNRETDAEYEKRLDSAYLLDAFAETVKKSVGRVFHRPPSLTGSPPWMDRVKKNFDGGGSSYPLWSRDTLADAMVGGVNFAFGDKKPKPEGETTAEALKRKPYAVRYPIEKVYGWQMTTAEDGSSQIGQIRFQESYPVTKGLYGVKRADQVRLIEPDHWETWREGVDGKWFKENEGPMDLGRVPVIPFFGMRTGPMSGITPLEGQCQMNLCHYQSSSAQRHILNVVRVPTLTLLGVSKDDAKSISLGIARAIRAGKDSVIKWLELDSGVSIEAGWKDLDRLERAMSELGMDIRAPRQTGDVTAAANWIGYESATSTLDAIAMGFTESFQALLDLFAEWEDASTAGTYALTTRDLLTSKRPEDLKHLRDMRQTGDLSQEGEWEELQRRQVLGEKFDAEREKERLAAEVGGQVFQGTWRAPVTGEGGEPAPGAAGGEGGEPTPGEPGPDQGGGAGDSGVEEG